MLKTRTIAKIDALVGFFFLLSIPFGFHYTDYLISENIGAYSRNVDNGAYFPQFAFVYLLPASLLFFAASVAIFRRWQVRKIIHGAAVAWVVLPLIVLLASAALHYVGS